MKLVTNTLLVACDQFCSAIKDFLLVRTGKTLSLLCSTLAWREAFKANLQLQHKLGSADPKNEFASSFKDQLSQAANWGGEEKTQGFFDVPRIIYASRTHSQLSQAVQEMKRTAYKLVNRIIFMLVRGRGVGYWVVGHESLVGGCLKPWLN